MSFSHTTTVKTTYSAGGVNKVDDSSYTKTASAEINLSETLTTNAVTPETPLEVTGFDFADNTTAQSLLFEWAQTAAEITAASCPSGFLTDQADAKLTDLFVNESKVWVEGNDDKWGAVPLNSSMTSIKFVPYDTAATTATGVLTVRVLYNGV